jgi:predicted ATP-grasp superfamily ATP-dependent carboligase
MKLDIKTVITLCTFVATLAGFYYSTQIRLDNLEEEVVQIEKQVKRLTRQLKNK